MNCDTDGASAADSLDNRTTFNQVFENQTFESLSGTFIHCTFRNCTFKRVSGLSLIDCSLWGSRLISDKFEDFLGFSITMQCKSVDELELSETAFDSVLLLLLKTSGNTEKRRKILSEVLGKDKVRNYLKRFSTLER